ncbi:hypothetical protein [Paracoccus albus]|uniref:hypothetical protein n=1 Tax=Paracoccus albus TaxID=3017784 RepID=UPI0022F0860C|nr:hypothetical protein [Paracoccus albus]WBU58975.1 hypothetical protein PAF20_09130 [Paracoccus albus]
MFRNIAISSLLLATSGSYALAQDAAPNQVQGIFTNAFAKGFVTEIEDLSQKRIQTNPQAGTIKAIYGNEEDTRFADVQLAPMPPSGFEPRFAGLRNAYEDISEMPVEEYDLTSPDGLPLACFNHRRADQGYVNCFAEMRGRLFRVQIGAVVDADAEALPDDIQERDGNLAGLFADSVNAAPDTEGSANDPLPALNEPAAEETAPAEGSDGANAADMSDIAPQDTPFAKALPENIDDRTIKEISVRGPKTTYVATYNDDNGDTTQVTLFAEHGDDPSGLRSFEKNLLGEVKGDLRDVEAESPDGVPMQCFHAVKDAGAAHNMCTAVVSAGIVEIQAMARVEDNVADAPDDVIEWAQDHAGKLTDALAELP